MVMQAMIGLILDVVMVGLLVTTITYCLKLNRRILVLQDSKGDMAQLIRQFDEATQKAAASIGELQEATHKLQDDMGAKIQKANFIADDLAFMIEKGNKVAERMLSGTGAPKAAAVAPQPNPAARPAMNTAPGRESPAINVPSRGPRLSMGGEGASPPGTPSAGGKPGALESVMERLGNKSAPTLARPAVAPPARNRSKTEQELLDALKNDV